MDTATLEGFRICLLQILREVAPHELPVSRLVLGAKLKGFTSADATLVGAELGYLEDKALVATPEKSISPENRECRITADGRDYLAKRGL